MHPQLPVSDAASTLPDFIVIAITVIVVVAISARLLHDIASLAINRASPEKIPAVVQALAALLHALTSFLPWSGRQGPIRGTARDDPIEHEALDNDSRALQQGGRHGA